MLQSTGSASPSPVLVCTGMDKDGGEPEEAAAVGRQGGQVEDPLPRSCQGPWEYICMHGCEVQVISMGSVDAVFSTLPH